MFGVRSSMSQNCHIYLCIPKAWEYTIHFSSSERLYTSTREKALNHQGQVRGRQCGHFLIETQENSQKLLVRLSSYMDFFHLLLWRLLHFV